MPKFQYIFKLKLNHEYYEDSERSHFSYTPETKTAEVLKKYQILLNQNVDGINLSLAFEGNCIDHLEYIQKNCDLNSLKIMVKANSSSFYLFTDLPAEFKGRIVYKCEIKDQSSDNSSIAINPEFYESGDFEEFALIEVPFSVLTSKEYQPANFLISLNSRKTTWVYKVITSKPDAFNSLFISKCDSIEFEKVKEEQEVISFTSNQSIPLKEKPLSQFDLIEQRPNNNSLSKEKLKSKIIYKGLPNPNLSMQEISFINQQSIFFSPMYIYV